MGITLNRTELIEALKAVKPGLSSREMVDQSTSFVFTKGGVSTYNGEVAVTHPIEGIGDLEGVVNSASLYGLLEKLSQEKLKVTVKDSELLISAGGARAGLVLESEIRLPLDEVDKKKCKWVKIPENLMKSFKFVLPACSRDLSMPILTCIHCDLSLGSVEASDTIRYCRHDFDSKTGESFLLPARTAGQLLAYEFTELAVAESWVHFRAENGMEVSCRRAAGQYPDTSIFEFKGKGTPLPEQLPEALERAHVFADRSYELSEEVEIELKKGEFILQSKGDSGWYKEKLKSTYKGKALKFMTHPTFLADACRQGADAKLGDGIMRFDGDGWTYVVALV